MQGETADRILDAANALMVERGYAAFSYADIAEVVTIRKASIHHHFPTKAGLAKAVLERHRMRLLDGMARLDAGFSDPLKRLQGYVRYWDGCIRDGSIPFCVAALLGAELPSLPDEVQAQVRLHFDALRVWLERTLRAGSKTGVIHLDGTVSAEAQLWMAVVHGAMLSARASGSCDVFKSITDTAMKRIAV